MMSRRVVVVTCIATTALIIAVAGVFLYPALRRYCRLTKAGPTPAGMVTAVNPCMTWERNKGARCRLPLSTKTPNDREVAAHGRAAPRAKHSSAIHGLALETALAISVGFSWLNTTTAAITSRTTPTKLRTLKRASVIVSVFSASSSGIRALIRVRRSLRAERLHEGSCRVSRGMAALWMKGTRVYT